MDKGITVDAEHRPLVPRTKVTYAPILNMWMFSVLSFIKPTLKPTHPNNYQQQTNKNNYDSNDDEWILGKLSHTAHNLLSLTFFLHM